MATVEALLRRLGESGWRPGAPAPAEAVERVEAEFRVAFPGDYRKYLLVAGGGETAAPESVTGLWPVRMLSVLNRRYRIPWNFPGLFGIGNDGFLTYVLDYRGGGPPVVASLGLSSSVWDDVVTETDTFSEWLERRLP